MRLLLVTPRNSYRTGAYLSAAAALDCSVTVVTDAAVAIPGTAIVTPLDDPTAAADRLFEQVEGRFDAVLGTDGASLAVAAELAGRLGLRSNPVGAIRIADDKLLQRIALSEAGVAQPRYARVGEGHWTEFPAVAKPVGRAGGQGVLPIESPEEYAAAVGRIQSLVGAEPILIESLVSGLEVAIEGLLVDGRLEVLAVFDKPDETVGSTFPETLLVQPARLSDDTVDRVIAAVEEAIAAVGLRHGPIHAECIIDGEDLWFLELAARTIGGLCSRTLMPGRRCLEEIVILQALGDPLPDLTTSAPSGALMLPVPVEGRLDGILGAERALAVPGVTDVVLSVGEGEYVRPLPEGDRYLGFVFAEGETADAVEASLRLAWSMLDVRISASSSGRTGPYPPCGR